MERWGICPSCERAVRLTEPELEAKRGFCAACDATFEVAFGAVRDEMVPYRRSDAQPQRQLIHPVKDDKPLFDLSLVPATGLHVGLRVPAVLTLSGTGASGWTVGSIVTILIVLVCGVIPALLVAADSLLATVSVLVLAGLALGTLLARQWQRNASGRDQIRIGNGQLVVDPLSPMLGVPFGLPLAEISDIIVEPDGHGGAWSAGRCRLRVVGLGRRSTLIGKGLGHGPTELGRVRDWMLGEIERDLASD